MVESVEGRVRGGGAPTTVQGLTIRPTPCLGPLVRDEAEDAGGQNTELEEDDCSTWGGRDRQVVRLVSSEVTSN